MQAPYAYTILHHTILCHTILYHIIPYHGILYHTLIHHTLRYHTIPHYTRLSHTQKTKLYYKNPFVYVACWASTVGTQSTRISTSDRRAVWRCRRQRQPRLGQPRLGQPRLGQPRLLKLLTGALFRYIGKHSCYFGTALSYQL